jgi:hypothetical protein
MTVTTSAAPTAYRFRDDQLRQMAELGYVAPPANGHPSPVRLTVDEYDHLIRLGVLTENDRCELIDGEVLAKMSIGDDHVTAVNAINNLLTIRCIGRAIVSSQNPVRLPPASEPEPDITVLPDQGGGRFKGKPHAEDVLLLIEVADTSFEYDRDVKGPIYAKAGIGEYWIVDVTEPGVHVFRDPRPDGTWGTALRPAHDATLAVPSLPGITVTVAELLG